jgi:hypothetical protein
MPAQDMYAWPDGSDLQQAFNYAGETQTWSKPRGIRMVHMLAISSGSGGGGGFSAGGATQAGGGSSGVGGPVASLLIPASFLPDLLYVSVGQGGQGASAGGIGGNGATSLVGSYSVIAQTTAFLASGGSSTISGGNPGTASAGGGAPSAGSQSAVSQCPLSASGTLVTVAGIAGLPGNATGGPSPLSLPSSIVSEGGAGAGTTGSANAAGAGVTGGVLVPWYFATMAGGAAGGGNAPPGFSVRAPMLFTGGLGGGSNFSGAGGAGGNGATGSGGGGGGGGVTGGAGGNGGNGLVIITCW